MSLTDRAAAIRRNPPLFIQDMLSSIKAQLGSDEAQIPDPTNPFVFLMENFVVNNAGMLNEQEALLRRYYPSMSLEYGELYAHMSDQDYVGRFVSPASGTFVFYFARDEIRNRAVDTGNGIRKITIPEYTSVKVSDLVFTMQYPVDIKVMRHGGIQVVYDNSYSSPIQELTTNSLKWDVVSLKRGGVNTSYIRIEVPMLQVEIGTTFIPINKTAMLNSDIAFTDNFFHCRVFYKNTGEWTEISTTHSDQVFNTRKPTALLTVKESSFNIRIPPVYFENGSIDNGNLRVDVYTSKGVISQDLSGYPSSSFTVSYLDNKQTTPLHYESDSQYIAPLLGFSDSFVMSTDYVDGGHRAKTFEELREQVIMNTLGANDVPISHPQLTTKVNDLGFDIVTHVDNLTNRQFLATRKLPIPTNNTLASGIGCTMSRIQLRLRELHDHPAAVTNGDRVTLKPDALYFNHGGRVTLVGGDEVNRLKNLGNDALTREVNNKGYLWSPFYYVLDASNDSFNVRPYDLSRPKINYKSLVDDNDTVDFQAQITSQSIEHTDYGYALTLDIECNDGMLALSQDDIVVQFSYRPSDGSEWCAQNAVFVGRTEENYLRYRCEFRTNFDIRDGDRLRTTNMSIFSSEQNNYYTTLDNAVDVTIMTVGQDKYHYIPNDLDQMIQTHLIPGGEKVSCITRERLHITFGTSLNNLWHQYRNSVTQYDYETYKEDIPYTFEEDKYEIIQKDNDIDFKLIQKKGDTLKNDKGEVVYRHRKGELLRDPDGKLILKNAREIIREFTLFLLDGTIFFVTDGEMVGYRNTVVESVIAWTKKVDSLKNILLDQCDIYLKPTTTLGDTVALVMANQKMTIPIAQSLTINYYVSDVIFRDTEYRTALKNSTREMVATLLDNSTVTITDITASLKSMANEGIIAIDVSGLGGVMNVTSASMLDDSVRLSIGKRLVVRSDHTLSIEDSIDINFARHTV